ncbi:uridine diphosphate-N-acetylglucosamine-binding protein YvcK [Luedemannella helvata]|uniref:Putative gluconeogenesis factor n=1 Tax=Luedemannella helvata TaxID=349315 RepID=A0ABN2KNC5_9ACTN
MTNVVAFGGGHGLATILRGLRLLRDPLGLDITAVVTVGDNGGSSGRLRAERGGLPPGDLRQALAALIDPDDQVGVAAAGVLQYRFGGAAPLAGHAMGNLLLCALMEQSGDPVAALELAGTLMRAGGRVLPMSRTPVDIEATVRGADPGRPGDVLAVRGQHAVAVTPGEVLSVRLAPPRPQACAEAVEAVRAADWLLFGPGSWYTSVIPHLLVPQLAEAIMASPAQRLVTLNLRAEDETSGLSLPDHLRALGRYLPGLRADVVLADVNAIGDPAGLRVAAESLGARVVSAAVAVADGSPRHNPDALAQALRSVLATQPAPEQAATVQDQEPIGQKAPAR